MATIYCFSATGNSLYAAKAISGEIGGRILPVTADPAPCGDDVIGLVFPVYYWGMPRLVCRFVENLKLTGKEPYVFAVTTFGGSAAGVLGWLTRIMKKSGISLSYANMLKSVANYIPEYSLKNTDEKRRQTDRDLAPVIEAIKAHKTNHKTGFTPGNRIAYNMYPDAASDKHFSVTGDCNGCGVCERVCPAGNIEMKGGRPEYLHRCENCLACLHNCPVCAIDWKNKTQGKERYRNPGITLEELMALNSGGK